MNAAAAVAALLGRPVAEVVPLGGAYRVRLTDGDEVVAKRHAQTSALRAEVAGLRWLRAASGPPNSSVTADTDSSHAADADRQRLHPPNPNESPIGAAGGPPSSTLPAGTDSSGPVRGNRQTLHPPDPSESPFRAPGGPPDFTLPSETDSSGSVSGNRQVLHPVDPSESPIGAPGGPPDFTLPVSTDSSRASVGGCPQVPEVFAVGGEWVVMEAVSLGRASVAAAEGFGRGLAALHGVGAEAFGVAPPGGSVDAWIGLAPMRNVAGDSWPDWYVEHRVLPYLRDAVDRGSLRDPAAVEAVCARVHELAGPGEPPARLHGDLWSGNVLWGTGDRVWLIDPAAHGGHRETDLAMLHLFGCSHLDRIVDAYREAWPLADGWRERIALHQLFPLLVHAVLFGGGYGAQAVAAARSLA